MTGSLFDDFKSAFSRPNNGLIQLILINISVFVAMGLLLVFSRIMGFEEVFAFIERQFILPAELSQFISRPWTLFSYAFMHSFSGIFHILFNMLVLYWFGRLFVEYLGSDRLIALYVLGALAGGAIYLLAYNFVPFYIEKAPLTSGMVGASAAVFAVAVAIATKMPNYTFMLLLFGPVRIKYLVAIYIFISLLGAVGQNAGGNLAHIGGALMGFVYMRALMNGSDIGQWITQLLDGINRIFSGREKIRVSHRREEPISNKDPEQSSRKSFMNWGNTGTKSGTSSWGNASAKSKVISQAEIDRILDKISESGYESLSKEEKNMLFQYSRKEKD